MADKLDIYSIEWEYEDKLPDMDDLDYDLLYPMSKVDGVRMFPFITVYDESGIPKRCWLGV